MNSLQFNFLFEGKKKEHGLKHLLVVTPCGLGIGVSKEVTPARVHDSHAAQRAALEMQIRNCMEFPSGNHRLFGDKGQ